MFPEQPIHAPQKAIRGSLVFGRCLVAVLLFASIAWANEPGIDQQTVPAWVQGEPHPVIIFDIDTLRADRLGCYGNPRPTSPVIDSLANEGVLFEWAFSQAPTTPPSQASILTSLYPPAHGVRGRLDRLSQEITTLAEVFQSEGFATAAFVDGGYMNRGFGLLQGFQTKVDRRGGLEEIGPKALKWIREHAEENFLLLVHTYDVHTPYEPPEPWRSQFLQGVPAPSPGFEPTTLAMEIIRERAELGRPTPLPANDIAYSLALYDAGIRYVDDWIGQFLVELKAVGIFDRSTLVVISDHGEEFQEHGSVLHDKLYSTVTRVPLIIRSPMALSGSRVPDVVETIDLLPTLLELVAAPPLEKAQGRSIAALLRGEELVPEPAFSEFRLFGGERAVTGPTQRLIYTPESNRIELYTYRQDVLEQEDLSGRFPRTVSDFTQQLTDWVDWMRTLEVPSSAYGDIDPEVEEQLRALGYIE